MNTNTCKESPETGRRICGGRLRSLVLLALDVELVLCLGGAHGRFFCSTWSGFSLALLCVVAWYMPRVRSWLRRAGQWRRLLPCCALVMAAGLAMMPGASKMPAGLTVLANALMLASGVLWLGLDAGPGEGVAAAGGLPVFLPMRFDFAYALPVVLAAQVAGVSAVSHSVALGVLVRGPSGPLILLACDAVFMLGLFVLVFMARSERRPSDALLVGCLATALVFAVAIAFVPKTGAAAESAGIHLMQNLVMSEITVRVCAVAFALAYRHLAGGGLGPRLLLLVGTFLAGTCFGTGFSVGYERLDNTLGYLACGSAICAVALYGRVRATGGRSVAPLSAQAGRRAESRDFAAGAKGLLTARELQVAELLAEGGTMAEVAKSLGLARSTVGSYSARIYEKLGVGSKDELISLLRPPEPEPISDSPATQPGKMSRFLAAGLALDLLVACLCIASFAGGPFLGGWPPVGVGASAAGIVAMAAFLLSLDGPASHAAAPFAAGLFLLGAALVLDKLARLPSAAMFVVSVPCCALCLVDGSACAARLGGRGRIGAVGASVAVAALLMFVSRGIKTVVLGASCFSRLVLVVAEGLMDKDAGPGRRQETEYSRTPRLVDVIGIMAFGAGIYSCCDLIGDSARCVPAALCLALACLCPRAISSEGDSSVSSCVAVLAVAGIALGMSLLGGEVPVAYAVAWGPVPLRLVVTVALLAGGACAVGGYLRSQRKRRRISSKFEAGQWEDLPGLAGVTPGECEVLLLLAKGFTVNQVASKLCLSPAAVASRRSKAYKKLGIHRRGQIAPVLEGLLEAKMAQV